MLFRSIKGHGYYISVDPGFLTVNNFDEEQVRVLIRDMWGSFGIETEAEFDGTRRGQAIPSGTRLILVGAKEPKIDELQANPDLYVIDTPVTKSGRATLLAFYHEQSVSITQHRFGAIQDELVNILNESSVKA